MELWGPKYFYELKEFHAERYSMVLVHGIFSGLQYYFLLTDLSH